MAPSSQQLAAAKNITTVFTEKKVRYALLKAECQAGKTGCFHEVIRSMLKSGEIQHAYILCGSSETELRQQANEDKEKHNHGAPIEVLFRQDFKGFTMEITNSLIVVDESHMDAGTGMQMDQFLGKHGLSMDGNPKELMEKNAFLLSVSATPYAEICAMQHKETPYEKHVENLESGDGYFGLAQFKYGGLMQPTFDVAKKMQDFQALFTEAPKYALIRLSQSKHCDQQETAIKAICRKKGYKVVYNTAEKTEIAIDELEEAPAVNTVVIVRGRLRAGKVVCKKHVAFVWEGAKSSDTAALVQGLPGRMCGYEFGETKPLIFVPASALKDYEGKVVKASEMDRAILCSEVMVPRKSKFLKPGQIASRTSDGMTQCSPIRLVDEGDEEGWRFTGELYEKSYSELRDHCFDLLKKNKHFISASTTLSEAQKDEINAIVNKDEITAAESSVRFQHTKNHYANIIKAYETGTVPNEPIHGHHAVNFILLSKDNKDVAGANKHHIYAIFYTKASAGVAGVMQAPLTARMPKTNGKSQFSVHHVSTPLVAGGVVGFNASNIKTPEELEKALRDYLTLFRTSDLTVSRCIQSVNDEFKLNKRTFGYHSSKVNKVEMMCKSMSTEFGVTLAVKYARSSTDCFKIKMITW
uniref:Uncharacterized protein n=1 Tax=viral metagenome TaxID=1070528 RepID=A0A6C0KNL9_9ZZZZ